MAHWVDLEELGLEAVTRQEARDQAVDYCRGNLVGHNLEVFKQRFQVSLRNDVQLFDAVKNIILCELQAAKQLDQVLEILNLISWLLRLNLSHVQDFWTVNVGVIRGVKQKFEGTSTWYNNFIGCSSYKVNHSVVLGEKVSLIEMMLQTAPELEVQTDDTPVEDDPVPVTADLTGCSTCKKQASEENGIILHEIDECKHSFCGDCLQAHCLQMLDYNNSNMQCPLDFVPIDRKLILTVLEKSQQQKYALLVQQNSELRAKNQKISCPRCTRGVSIEGIMGDCIFCSFIFCTMCLQSFHGTIDCSSVENENEATVSPSKSSPSDSSYHSASNEEQASASGSGSGLANEVGIDLGASSLSGFEFGGAASLQAQLYGNPWLNNSSSYETTGEPVCFGDELMPYTDWLGKSQHQKQPTVVAVHPNPRKPEASIGLDLSKNSDFGAMAKPHEVGFYSQESTEVTFSVDEISAAFQIPGIERHLSKWPWEVETSDQNPLKKFRNPFSSLNADEWVEDVVLEDAMKNIVRRAGLESSVAVLESYMMRWAMQKTYDDTTLCSLVREKNLTTKSVIAALINTELSGCGGHWILGLVDILTRRIILLDSSLVASCTFYQKYFFCLLHILHISSQLAGIEITAWNKWELVVSLNTIQQTNIVDCGPITVANFYAGIHQEMLDSTPPGFRLRRWIHEIVSTKNTEQDGDGDQEPNFESIEQAPVDDEICIKPFSPTRLWFSYRETTQLVSELQFPKETFC